MPTHDLPDEARAIASFGVRAEDPAERPGHRPPTVPGTSTHPTDTPEPTTNVGTDRMRVIGDGFTFITAWTLRAIVVAGGLWLLWWVLDRVWFGVLPILLALIVATLLSPVVALGRRWGLHGTLATILTLLLSLGLVVGVFAALAPSITSQSREIFEQASGGVDEVREWIGGPPLNLDNAQIDEYLGTAISWLQERSSVAAGAVASGLGAVGSALVTLGLMVVLLFFFLKDGPRFLPWLRRTTGRTVGRHLTEALTRMWTTLGGFIRTQAIVSAVDAVLIGIGLLVLQVPLALTLAVLTFFGGFIPIVGAVVAGGLAVLVALVTQGFTTALWVLAIVLAVQQIEGNVLQPALQGRSMQMHPGIVLLAVAGGSTLFGIIGAFLAVPFAATFVVLLRYLSELVDLRSGDVEVQDIAFATPEGRVAGARTQHAGEDERAARATATPSEGRQPQARTGFLAWLCGRH
ncbi:AI-2E family transporter [Serinicoccus kebangsaanensis]|uniref:AI-2E family transporter n=1 Tax=Serinicoccus kebangsaanensis TaxID=2602069 RepID=UPI00124F2521|nr:AI-2E family transporter [Serinicoccus kebangsaanensis]